MYRDSYKMKYLVSECESGKVLGCRLLCVVRQFGN